MKLLLLLLCLLLCGCAQDAPETETQAPMVTAATVPEPVPISMYDPEDPLEKAYQGGLKVYPLTMRKVQGIRAMGDGLLVFSGYGSTTLTMLTGDTLLVSANVTLDFQLDPKDPSLRVGDGTLSFFDPTRNQTVVLNEELKEIRHITMTEGFVGSPILSAGQNTLFYCTSTAICAWELETNIHRTIKELSYDDQALTGLHLNDTVLQCRIQDGETIQTLFLSAQTGQLVSQQAGDAVLVTEDDRYYAVLSVSEMDMQVFGQTGGTPQILYPKDLAAKSFYLPKSHAVITASILADERVELNCYDLNTGICQAELTLDALQQPKSIVTGSDGCVYILAYEPANDCDTVYRWEISAPVFASDAAGMVYTDAYSGWESANYEALAQCQAYAAQLSEKYGIQILVWEDALAVQPWDYELEAESLPRVLQQELELLDRRLSQYPEVVLEKTMSHFSSLNICLVRQITGAAASGSLDTATGIQFLDGTDAYVAIAVGKYSQQALYHELFHVMETHILNESAALDIWNELNPEGFEYSYGYGSAGDTGAYLSGETRAFVDAYSMSFPKEDRARVWENAMLPGNAELFESEILQAKLTALCEGVRKAYGLRKSPETFPWEQYLETPLAYTQ